MNPVLNSLGSNTLTERGDVNLELHFICSYLSKLLPNVMPDYDFVELAVLTSVNEALIGLGALSRS